MGFFKDLFKLSRTSDGIRTINQRILLEQDSTTGKSNLITDIHNRRLHLKNYEIQHPETNESILQKIQKYKESLCTATSENEKNYIRSELSYLYSKYNQLLDEEKNHSKDESSIEYR